MEIFYALMTLCKGNLPAKGGFPSHRPVTRSFDVFFNLHLKKRLSKQSRRRWLETPLRSLWRNYINCIKDQLLVLTHTTTFVTTLCVCFALSHILNFGSPGQCEVMPCCVIDYIQFEIQPQEPVEYICPSEIIVSEAITAIFVVDWVQMIAVGSTISAAQFFEDWCIC